MNLLLDTHCWLWALSEPEKLNSQASDLISDSANKIYLSTASIWELGIKAKLGKIQLPEPFETFVPNRLQVFQTIPLPITASHAITAATLPLHHKDPFDRMIIAQGQSENLAILSNDNAFHDYDITLIKIT
ncbi:MAG: type II toxin-antitoxin system VapC family toxin [Crocosphaera sp.]